jgi:hypothetical protein
MHKALFLALLLLLVFTYVPAQQEDNLKSNNQTGSNHLASLDIHLPLGVFAKSHFAGIGLNYSWSNHRFGTNISGEKLAGLTLNAGGNYYFGKNVSPAGYDFRYGGYIYFHVMPGLLFNPWRNANISVNAGPTMGIYSGDIDFGFGVMTTASYYITEKIAAGTGISFKKHYQTDPLWACIARISFTF